MYLRDGSALKLRNRRCWSDYLRDGSALKLRNRRCWSDYLRDGSALKLRNRRCWLDYLRDGSALKLRNRRCWSDYLSDGSALKIRNRRCWSDYLRDGSALKIRNRRCWSDCLTDGSALKIRNRRCWSDYLPQSLYTDTMSANHSTGLLLLLRSQLDLWGSPFLVKFLHTWPFYNPTRGAVTFCLCGWCMLGVSLLSAFTHLGHKCQDLLSPCDGIHVCTDYTLVYILIWKSF